MSIEYLAPGIKCDLKCKYCYQDPMRDVGNITTPTNWMAVKARLDSLGQSFTLFGGEALLTPKAHMEEVFAYGLEKYGRNGIQTNALRLDTDHILMFKKYNVSVGVSIDGHWPLNSLRSTQGETERILMNIRNLCQAGVVPSVIVTIHKENGKRAGELMAFVNYLNSIGITNFNFHILEDHGDEKFRLTDVENFSVFKELYWELKGRNVYASPFTDIKALLTGSGNSSCIWNACDPLTTPAVQGISPDGTLSNCGRTNKDGVNWTKADEHGKERYKVLFNTPQEHGGCQGCKYFFACKGQCPGTAIDGDWRNRTVHCVFWYDLIQYIAHDLQKDNVRLLQEEKIKEIERNLTSTYLPNRDHGDIPHGDTPHGDEHGDHNDYSFITPKGQEIKCIA